MEDIIKEYLVSLGYKIDQSSQAAFSGALKDSKKLVEGFADSALGRFALVGAGVVTMAAAVVASLYKVTVGLAQADLQNDMFARRMWMSKDAAMSYQNSLDALGASLQDLYLSPELMGRFQELRKEAAGMGMPGGFSEAMKGIRDVTFEFQRMKLEGTYAIYWIGYYVTKYLTGPTGIFKGGLKEINDKIQANMPQWTKKVADVLVVFVRMGETVYTLVKRTEALWDSLGKGTKTLLEIGAALWVLSANPIMLVVAGLVLLIALLDDYYSYESGKKSALPELWKGVDKFKKGLQDSGVIKEFIGDIEKLSTNVLDLVGNIGKLLDNLAKLMGYKNFGDALEKNIIAAFRTFDGVVQSIAGALEIINGYLEKDQDKIGLGKSDMKKGWVGAMDSLQGSPLENVIPFVGPLMGMIWKKYGASMGGASPVSFTTHNYIYGSGSPTEVASAIDRSNKAVLMRYLQGVNR